MSKFKPHLIRYHAVLIGVIGFSAMVGCTATVPPFPARQSHLPSWAKPVAVLFCSGFLKSFCIREASWHPAAFSHRAPRRQRFNERHLCESHEVQWDGHTTTQHNTTQHNTPLQHSQVCPQRRPFCFGLLSAHCIIVNVRASYQCWPHTVFRLRLNQDRRKRTVISWRLITAWICRRYFPLASRKQIVQIRVYNYIYIYIYI